MPASALVKPCSPALRLRLGAALVGAAALVACKAKPPAKPPVAEAPRVDAAPADLCADVLKIVAAGGAEGFASVTGPVAGEWECAGYHASFLPAGTTECAVHRPRGKLPALFSCTMADTTEPDAFEALVDALARCLPADEWRRAEDGDDGWAWTPVDLRRPIVTVWRSPESGLALQVTNPLGSGGDGG